MASFELCSFARVGQKVFKADSVIDLIQNLKERGAFLNCDATWQIFVLDCTIL